MKSDLPATDAPCNGKDCLGELEQSVSDHEIDADGQVLTELLALRRSNNWSSDKGIKIMNWRDWSLEGLSLSLKVAYKLAQMNF